MSDPIKFVRAELQISSSVAIDCYMMPSGEKRVGITGAALAVGRAKDYLSKVVSRESKTLEALQDMGFQGSQIEGNVIRSDGRGSPIAKTISIRDFTKYVTWEAVKNRKAEAIIILAAFAETGIEQTLDLLFAGKSTAFILDKIVHFSKWTHDDLMQALASNWEDAREIEEHQRFLRLGR